MKGFGSQRTAVGWVLALALSPAACSSSSATAPPDAPENHTVMRGGAAHATGLSNPTQNCTTCHGATLQGGSAGQPSCFSCHGKKW